METTTATKTNVEHLRMAQL